MRKNIQTRDEFCSTVELSASEKEYSAANGAHSDSHSNSHSESADRPERIVASDRQREEREQREAEQKIERCLLYMMQNLNARITISALSSQAGVSASYFYSLFRRATGYSPGDFLIRARMRRACELLRDTSLKVKEV